MIDIKVRTGEYDEVIENVKTMYIVEGKLIIFSDFDYTYDYSVDNDIYIDLIEFKSDNNIKESNEEQR